MGPSKDPGCQELPVILRCGNDGNKKSNSPTGRERLKSERPCCSKQCYRQPVSVPPATDLRAFFGPLVT